jgi:hypothetical protein
MAEIFQTFLLIATFDIALIAITIGNYAVSASYLGRETRLTRSRMDKRKEKLNLKLIDLQKESLKIESIKQEIKQAENDMDKLNTRIFLLSWLGAVISPSSLFIVSLVTAMLGMNADILTANIGTQGFYEQQFMIFSSGTLASGFLLLLVVIGVIDSAARRIPIPEFEVSFQDRAKTIKLKSGRFAEVTFCITNKGEAIAENLLIIINFPNVFRIQPYPPQYEVMRQGIESDYPDYIGVIIRSESQHIDTSGYTQVIITTSPEKKETYEIPIVVYEEKTGKTKYSLNIEIVD